MMSGSGEGLDETLCKQMSSLVELLTTSGKPTLNPEIMKKFKKICRISDAYIEHAFEQLMSQMTADHSEIRLSTFQMIDELFTRSHAFRQLLVDDFQTFLELSVGSNLDYPLPPPKFAAETMKSQAYVCIQAWQDRFGEAYKKLALGYNFLKTCKKVDFAGIQARVEQERQQKEDTERKLEEARKVKIEKIQNEFNDQGGDMGLCVTEIENSIQLLLPHPEDFFIPTSEPDQGDASRKLATDSTSEPDQGDASRKLATDSTSEPDLNNASCKLATDSHHTDLTTTNNIHKHDKNALRSSNSGSSDCTFNTSKQSESEKRTESCSTASVSNQTSTSQSSQSSDQVSNSQESSSLSSSVTQTGSIACDPTHSDPTHSDPTHSDPTHSDPTHSDPIESKVSDSSVRKVGGEKNHVDSDQIEGKVGNSAEKKMCEPEASASNGHNDHDNDNEEEEEEEEEESEEEEFEGVDESTSGLRHELGVFSHQFNITVEMGDSGSRICETEDNRDVIQGLRDQYRLLKTKYMPAVKRWIQGVRDQYRLLKTKYMPAIKRRIQIRSTLHASVTEVLTKTSGSGALQKEVETLKERLEDAAKKCIELEVVTAPGSRRRGGDSDSDSDEDFEDVQEKEGYEEDVPEHVRLEAARTEAAAASTSRGRGGRGRGRKRASPGKRGGGKKSSVSFWNLAEQANLRHERDVTTGGHNVGRAKAASKATSTVTSAMLKHEPSSKAVVKTEPGTSSSSPSKSPKKSATRDQAPVVSFGLDLEHWENPENIKAPARVKYDDLGRVWTGNSVDEEVKASSEEVEALTSRAFIFAGKFEPVKWKCRAPMPSGKLCERMDRVTCPFHGKIIGRDEEGTPSDPAEAAALAANSELPVDMQDPELADDMEAQTSVDLGAAEVKVKGKGKGKAEKRKHPNLTDIKPPKSTCRSRLESKIFKKATMKKVNAALDAVAAKKLADKFGNNFNYSLK